MYLFQGTGYPELRVTPVCRKMNMSVFSVIKRLFQDGNFRDIFEYILERNLLPVLFVGEDLM